MREPVKREPGAMARYRLIRLATIKSRTTELSAACAERRPLPAAPALDLSFAQVARQRRSAVDFDGTTSITSAAFFAMLECLMTRSDTPPWNVLVSPAQCILRSWCIASRDWRLACMCWSEIRKHCRACIHRCAPNGYGKKRDRKSAALFSAAVRFARLSKVYSLSSEYCGRFLLCARHADAVCKRPTGTMALPSSIVGMRHARPHALPRSRSRWSTRYGIGCFFGDQMHALLGLKDHAWQSLYHFTVGGAVDDQRLSSEPPYQRQG